MEENIFKLPIILCCGVKPASVQNFKIPREASLVRMFSTPVIESCQTTVRISFINSHDAVERMNKNCMRVDFSVITSQTCRNGRHCHQLSSKIQNFKLMRVYEGR